MQQNLSKNSKRWYVKLSTYIYILRVYIFDCPIEKPITFLCYAHCCNKSIQFTNQESRIILLRTSFNSKDFDIDNSFSFFKDRNIPGIYMESFSWQAIPYRLSLYFSPCSFHLLLIIPQFCQSSLTCIRDVRGLFC